MKQLPINNFLRDKFIAHKKLVVNEPFDYKCYNFVLSVHSLNFGVNNFLVLSHKR